MVLDVLVINEKAFTINDLKAGEAFKIADFLNKSGKYNVINTFQGLDAWVFILDDYSQPIHNVTLAGTLISFLTESKTEGKVRIKSDKNNKLNLK